MERQSIRIERTNDGYEKQYIDILRTIKYYGFHQENTEDGTDIICIPHAVISVNLEDEFPILKCREVNWKRILEDILWIMQLQSNNTADLSNDLWRLAANEDGTVGKSLGYQVGKEVYMDNIRYDSQVHYVLNRLSADPFDRSATITLWDVDDLNDMKIFPDCVMSSWNIVNGQLNCMIIQKDSSFNAVPEVTTQYAMLLTLFARHIGVDPGRLTHVMSDVYINDTDEADRMIENHNRWYDGALLSNSFVAELSKSSEVFRRAIEVDESVPVFVVNSDETDFFAIELKDCSVDDYKYMD